MVALKVRTGGSESPGIITNDLDVYEYLKYLLEEMPNNHYLENPEILERYLPWSEELPDRCRLKRTYKKCLKQ